MNKTLEQYQSSLYGLIPDYRGRFSEQVIAKLSQYVPENEQQKIGETIRVIREQIDEAIEKDGKNPRYEATYIERLRRHIEHKKAYEENTPFTP